MSGYIVPLKKLDLFLGAIPSKIFDALALSKPILLGVDGEAKSLFIDQGQAGIYFEPENEISLAKALIELENEPLRLQSMEIQEMFMQLKILIVRTLQKNY